MLNSTFFQLLFPSRVEQEKWISKRDGEVRVGEKIKFRNETSAWKQEKYHLLGVCEDVGPRLNAGRGGATKGFEAFISRFLGMQVNRFFDPSSCCVHGVVKLKKDEPLSNVLIDDLDELLVSWCQEVVASNGIPIVIGGGHNNAYPLIKGCSLELQSKINVVNLDPHADTRKLEGRHSGNPFSYAFENKYLKQYAVLGLHESYNNEFILQKLEEMKAIATYFESWLGKPHQFQSDIDKVYDHFYHENTGIELDMDAIAGMPTSAFTPSGITVEQARIYIRKMATMKQVRYLHLPEAAPSSEQEELIVGKTLAYLVSDFIKENGKKHV
ncbi:MAG TPA: formimidoylglutamase [Fluviicola sp.]|nr:formimidoylglutamase [Fluviicola sp.]